MSVIFCTAYHEPLSINFVLLSWYLFHGAPKCKNTSRFLNPWGLWLHLQGTILCYDVHKTVVRVVSSAQKCFWTGIFENVSHMSVCLSAPCRHPLWFKELIAALKMPRVGNCLLCKVKRCPHKGRGWYSTIVKWNNLQFGAGVACASRNAVFFKTKRSRSKN